MRIISFPPSRDYWDAVTNVVCPECEDGLIRWYEAGYAPGHRRCDRCGSHWVAHGDSMAPRLERAILIDGLILGWDESQNRGYAPEEGILFGESSWEE